MTGAAQQGQRAGEKLGVTYEFLLHARDGEQLRKIADLVDAGAIRPIVGATSPFDDARRLSSHCTAVASAGKSVLRGA